jgi:hypothetical protein
MPEATQRWTRRGAERHDSVMATKRPGSEPATITINRAPVLTLWAAVVAERLGFDRDEAATLGRAVAGLYAQVKGQRLGLFTLASEAETARRRRAMKPGESERVELLGRAVPVVRTPDGLRAATDGKPGNAAAVHRYLESRFGDALAPARAAMEALARTFEPSDLAGRAFSLYEAFRPSVPAGTRGWGAKGMLDLGAIRGLAGRRPRR